MSLFYLFVARGGRKRGNRRTDRPSTVTLAAHARRRGLMKQGNCGVLLVEGVGYGVWEVHVQTISISVCADVEVTKPSGPFFVILILSSCESVIFSSYRFCPFLWVRGVVNGPSAMTTSSVL